MRWMLGVKSRSTVLRYLSGERMPSPDRMRRIHQVTDGRVTVADFLDPAPPKCVRVVIDRKGEPRHVYPWTELELARERSSNDNHRSPPTTSIPPYSGPPSSVQQFLNPPKKPNQLQQSEDPEEWPYGPLRRAIGVLGPRVRHTRRGRFLLDGRVTDPKRIVIAANRVLRSKGECPIPYPGVDSL